MKSFFLELFSENGKISSMRAMAFVALAIGGFISIYGMTTPNPDYSGITLLAGMFVGAAFGGKVLQKRSEKSPDNKINSENNDTDSSSSESPQSNK